MLMASILGARACKGAEVNELALFAGAGGGILAGHLLGWNTVCAVERDAYAAQVLAQRQNDGSLAPFPIWSDVETFNGKPWHGIVDVVSGGFPCQDISAAGKGGGIEASRSGLWKQMVRIVGEVRPKFVFVENSPLLVKRGLAVVLGDLAEMGYDAEWCIVSASDVGAPHKRDRIWLFATNSDQAGLSQRQLFSGIQRKGRCASSREDAAVGYRWPTESGICRVDDGMANRVDRIKAIGNGQVPRVAATAFDILGR